MKIKHQNKSGILLCLLFISPLLSYAQEVDKTVDLDYLPNLMGDIVIAVSAIVIVVILGFIIRFNFLLMAKQKERLYQQQGIKLPAKAPSISLWERIYNRSTKLVPLEKEADIMLDHNYDGIRELDNSLPPWWVAMFYITIVIGTVYFGYYHYYDLGLSSSEAYVAEMEIAQLAKERYLEQQANAIDESNVTLLVDAESLSAGSSIFKSKCALCHGQLGEGGVGPNLTDDYWIHGADIKSVFATIKYGVPQKGMTAWNTQLRPAEMHFVASFILSMKGTNPPNAKGPQGIKVDTQNLIEGDSTNNAIGLK